MIIEKVKLENFRNYTSCELKLSPGLNIFKGNNAQGKTNFLESVYISSIGKSPKTNKEKDLIKWGSNFAKVYVKSKKKYYDQTIELVLNDQTNKIIKINGMGIKRIGDLIGEMPVVYFAPDEIGLIKDGPADRRRFMDIDISQLNKQYFYNLLRYDKILNERNKLLKQTKTLEGISDTIDLWDIQLADVASRIIFQRLWFLDKIKEPAKKIHHNITSGKEDLDVKYQGINLPTVQDIKNKIYQSYKANLKRDFEFGYTTIGPHRDDIQITINGIDIRNFGSQGQQRLATLSLKIAELVLFEKELGEKPVLLLDDVLSELDNKRCQNFLREIENYQTILTTTKYTRKLRDIDAMFQVKDAKISRL